MNPLRTSLVALTLAGTATLSLATASPATRTPDSGIVRSDEISATQRNNQRRPARSYQAPRYYRGSPDPSIGPDGRPYRVPEYLRNQCYVDDGYGRFSACSNR